MRPLPHPPDAELDKDSLEMLRGWVVDGELQVIIAAWVWEDEPAQWGRLLAETAGHLSDAIGRQTGRPKEEVFEEIAHCLRHYLANPKQLEGDFMEPEPREDS